MENDTDKQQLAASSEQKLATSKSAAELEAAAALLDLGLTADATQSNLSMAAELSTEPVEDMLLDGPAPTADDTPQSARYVSDGDVFELQDTVTEAQLAAAAESDHVTYMLKNMVLAADATQESLTDLLCTQASILQIDNPIAEQVGKAMRAMADRGRCHRLDLFIKHKQLPTGMLAALCYLISKDDLTSLSVVWGNGKLAGYRQLWAALCRGQGLWNVEYDDGGFVYDRDPSIIQRWLTTTGVAATVETLELSLNGSKTRANHAALTSVLQHLRQFQALKELTIAMRSEASAQDKAAIQQFAVDRPRNLHTFHISHGEQQTIHFEFDNKPEFV